MHETKLSEMTVPQLMEMREEVERLIAEKASAARKELERQLAAIDAVTGSRGGRRAGLNPRKGVKVAPKYRSPDGETWAGRGARPRWLVEALKAGSKVEDFAINNDNVKRRGRPRKAA